jgi:hypothetical protein
VELVGLFLHPVQLGSVDEAFLCATQGGEETEG